MIQSRHEFLTELLDYIGEAGDTGAYDTLERILNVALQTLWGQRAWRAFLHPTPYELSLTAGTRTYALPDYFGRISGADGILRNLTTGRALSPTTRAILETVRPAAGTSLDTLRSEPTLYCLNGTMAVHTQPAAAGEALEVVSDVAGDTESLVSVAGVNGDGQWTREQVTLTGTGAVAVGTWKEIHEFGKTYPSGITPATEHTSSRGNVTLRKVTGAVELQKLLPAESARVVQCITFDPTPDAAYVVGVPFIRAVQKSWRAADAMPFGWGPALREECLIQWHVNAGRMTLRDAASHPRPALYNLVCDENAALSQFQRQRIPYAGR